MEKQTLFTGKVQLADQLVDFRIYKNMDADIVYYSFEVNPEVRDRTQVGFHNGETQRATDLENLLLRFNSFQKDFTKIIDTRENKSF